MNEFQQDSLSLTDVEDIASVGQEVSASLPALGIATFDQAGRILKHNLDRSIQGNTYVEFETSVKAIGIQPGDLITITYLKEGFQRQPFRVLRISASKSYGSFRILAQIHADMWYADTNGQSASSAGARRQPHAGVGIPRPLAGNIRDADDRLIYEITESVHPRADGGSVVHLTTGFAVPRRPSSAGPAIPLLSLAPEVETTGGSLQGNQALYYAVSAVDAHANESALSFIVRAELPAFTNSNQVTVKRLSFSSDTTNFHVYRGSSPDRLLRIATSESSSNEFTDVGLPEQSEVPADASFDRANFYWRFEVSPEMSATIQAARIIGNDALSLEQNEWRGLAVRITRGRGEGQERIIEQNTESVLTLDRDWDVEPDATSNFTVAEPGWRFGATGQSSPVAFEVPNRAGAVVQVCGRAANAMNVESAYELSTITRKVIGGDAGLDEGPPPTPLFGLGLSPVVAGALELSGIGFSDLTNTRTIEAATLVIFYRNELADGPAPRLTDFVGTEEDLLKLDSSGTAEIGNVLQVKRELLRVEEVLDGGRCYRVSRGIQGSEPSEHDAGESVYFLQRRIEIMPFPHDFFGSPASGAWKQTIVLPDSRIASAEMFVTNSKGQSETSSQCLTGTADGGLRTLSGGQLSFQIDGFLAVENDAAPDIYVDASHAIRDIFAFVRQSPSGAPVELRLKQNGIEQCTLFIQPGATTSQVIDGFGLTPLKEGSRLALDVVAVGSEAPGSDLTVVIRL